MHINTAYNELSVTRIPSGIWSRLLAAVCERRVSSQHMVKSLTVNPYMSLFNLKLLIFEPIFGQQISALDPPYIDFLVRLGLNFHPELRGESVGPATFLGHGRTET